LRLTKLCLRRAVDCGKEGTRGRQSAWQCAHLVRARFEVPVGFVWVAQMKTMDGCASRLTRASNNASTSVGEPPLGRRRPGVAGPQPTAHRSGTSKKAFSFFFYVAGCTHLCPMGPRNSAIHNQRRKKISQRNQGSSEPAPADAMGRAGSTSHLGAVQRFFKQAPSIFHRGTVGFGRPTMDGGE